MGVYIIKGLKRNEDGSFTIGKIYDNNTRVEGKIALCNENYVISAEQLKSELEGANLHLSKLNRNKTREELDRQTAQFKAWFGEFEFWFDRNRRLVKEVFAKGNDHVIAIMQNYIDNLPEILDKKIGHWFEPHETEQFQKRIALDQENMKQELAKYKIDRSYLEQSA